MAYLVRKLNKGKAHLSLLKDITDIYEIIADLPTCEFKTSEGKLSTYIIHSLDELDDAVLAIATTSTKIERMDFIIIKTELLDDNGLEYKQTYPGMDIPVPDLQNNHYDILDVTLSKLYNCTSVYKTIIDNEGEEEKFVVRYTCSDLKGILRKAINNNRVDVNKAKGDIKKLILEMEAA